MKHADQMAHAKQVKTIALTRRGEFVGKIIANISNSSRGNVWTVSVSVWKGPLGRPQTITKKAGGCGYCKFSHAVGAAMGNREIMSAGYEAVQKYFESNGYEYLDVL